MLNELIRLSNITVGLLMILLSITLKNGSIKMNHWYGFRISKSFESDELGYKINEYGAKRFMMWSIPLFIVVIISFVILFDNNFWLILFFSFFPIIIIIALIECIQYSNHL